MALPVAGEVVVLVEVDSGVRYPGGEVGESGGAQLAVVVELAHVVDDPCRRLGEHVVGDGEGALLAGVSVWVGAVAGEHARRGRAR